MATNHSADHSSADEIEDDSTVFAEGHWHDSQDPDHHASPSQSGSPSTASTSKPPVPAQKRRRVTRACDECRRKKIKCDGKQPCTHCTVYSYECTYDQPSNRRRNPAPQYIEALEARLHRAESLLKTVLPDIDLNDPNLDLTTPQRIIPPVKRNTTAPGLTAPKANALKNNAGGESGDESLLESMVENTGTLDLDDQGHWDFHGHSSGITFFRRMREQFGDLFGPELYRGATLFARPRPMSQFFDSPRSGDSPVDILAHIQDLPSREIAKELCSNALDDACTLMRYVHQPSFYAMFDRVYDTQPESYTNEENRFLPLLYVVMALGCLFAKTEDSKLNLSNGYEGATEQGFQFFRAGRQMMDITDCRDLTSLQAIVSMILFLQSSARLSTCYSYIGIALRSALRMGLHRKVSIKFDPIERETRKRIFWIIHKMDIYVGALLGLPQMLSDDDIDQEDPIEVDDEFITLHEIKPMPSDRVSFIAGSNAHTRLVRILQKIVKYIYPLKGLHGQNSKSEQSYVVSHSRIREIERDLQIWMESLPMALRPGDEAPKDLIRLQNLLRMSYAHVQMMLYRPFLHYVANTCSKRPVDKRSYACAAACVSISRNIVHITTEMKNRGLLIGSYWFTMYTTFFAILSLVFFVLENPESATGQDIFKDALEGKEVLGSLAKRSMAADRCSMTLADLFATLPEKITNGRRSAPSNKKRAPPSPNLQGVVAARSNPDLSRVAKSDGFGSPQRASTFPSQPGNTTPKGTSTIDTNLPSTSLDDNQIYLSGSRESFTPTESTAYTPESVPSFITSQALAQSSPQQSSFSQPTSSTGFPDLSSMMFPSADPFAYPNQPLSALEDGHQFTKQESGQFGFPGGNTTFFPNDSTTSSMPFENIDVALFGAGLPYMMQGLVSTQQNFQTPMEWNNNEIGTPTNDQQSWPQHPKPSGPSGMNLDDILGPENWHPGWTSPSYRQ